MSFTKEQIEEGKRTGEIAEDFLDEDDSMKASKIKPKSSKSTVGAIPPAKLTKPKAMKGKKV
jgi:hypothetical protein